MKDKKIIVYTKFQYRTDRNQIIDLSSYSSLEMTDLNLPFAPRGIAATLFI
jgi:hypothetical protein